jgi:hypothetical protein
MNVTKTHSRATVRKRHIVSNYSLAGTGSVMKITMVTVGNLKSEKAWRKTDRRNVDKLKDHPCGDSQNQ